jgi:ribosomal protein L16 Arg81 hydroxylase
VIQFEVTAAEFRDRLFEKQPCVQRSALRDRHFQWCDLEDVLNRIEARAPSVKLYRDAVIPEEAFTEDVMHAGVRRRVFQKPSFYRHMHGGATLILNRFEFHEGLARELCSSIAAYARMQTTCNAYLSFGGDGSFGQHWDTHDVFAFQVLGRKRWQVYEPTLPLPLSHQRSDTAGGSPTRPPALDCVLEAGDVLYLPRGWWHRTIPFDEGSFHISVGTYGSPVYDYCLWACTRAVPLIEAARKAFVPGDSRGLQEIVQAVSEALLDPSLQHQFGREVRALDRASGEVNLQLFLERGRVPSAGAKLRLTLYDPVMLDDGSVLVNGKRVHLDPVTATIVELLQRESEVTYERLGLELNSVTQAQLLDAVLILLSQDVLTLRE